MIVKHFDIKMDITNSIDIPNYFLEFTALFELIIHLTAAVTV